MNSMCLARGPLGPLVVLDASLPAERVQSGLLPYLSCGRSQTTEHRSWGLRA